MIQVYLKSPDFVERAVAGECILVPIRRHQQDANSIFVLNETGATFWRYLDGRRTVADILREFQEEFDVTPDQLAKDVSILLDDLRSIDAITLVTP
jgi:hypothetical protein